MKGTLELVSFNFALLQKTPRNPHYLLVCAFCSWLFLEGCEAQSCWLTWVFVKVVNLVWTESKGGWHEMTGFAKGLLFENPPLELHNFKPWGCKFLHLFKSGPRNVES